MAFQLQFFVDTNKDLGIHDGYEYSAWQFRAVTQGNDPVRGFLNVQRFSEKNPDDHGNFVMEIGNPVSIAAIKNAGRMGDQQKALEGGLLQGIEINPTRLEKFDANSDDGFDKAISALLGNTNEADQTAEKEPQDARPHRSHQGTVIGLGKLGL